MIGLIHQFLALPIADHLSIGGVMLFDWVVAPRLGIWMYSLFALLGTAAHEGLHWIFARMLGAKPSFPNIIPKNEGRVWRLGSVEFVPSFLNRVPVTLAPALLLPAGIWYAVAVMHPSTGGWYAFNTWVVASFFVGSFPSRQDWSVAMPTIATVMNVLVVIATVMTVMLVFSYLRF